MESVSYAMVVQGIIFDIENIFFDGTFWHRYLHQTVSRLGCNTSFDEFQTIWRRQYLPKVYSGEHEYWDALASFFRFWGLGESEVKELLAASQPRLKQAQASLRLLPFVNESIHRLRNLGLRLGIVCNSIHMPKQLVEMLCGIQMNDRFDCVLTSREAQRVLPDPDAFHWVAGQLGIAATQLAYVSSQAVRLEIARNSGLVPIQFLCRMPLETKLDRDHSPTISNLSELNRMIAQRDNGQRETGQGDLNSAPSIKA